MEPRSNRNSIREFVDGLAPGSRVVWIANGGMGTVQTDKSILWDDGNHMTRRQMNDTYALLIHSETESRTRHQAVGAQTICVKNGCTLTRWNAADCSQGRPEQSCPLAVVPELEIPAVIGRRKHHLKAVRAHAS